MPVIKTASYWKTFSLKWIGNREKSLEIMLLLSIAPVRGSRESRNDNLHTISAVQSFQIGSYSSPRATSSSFLASSPILPSFFSFVCCLRKRSQLVSRFQGRALRRSPKCRLPGFSIIHLSRLRILLLENIIGFDRCARVIVFYIFLHYLPLIALEESSAPSWPSMLIEDYSGETKKILLFHWKSIEKN